MEDELSHLVALLTAEFPDCPRSVIEAALREHDNDVSAARRALYAASTTGGGLSTQPSGGGSSTGPAAPHSPSGASDSWNLGLDEVTNGLSNLGAQLSLGFRQVAHSLGQLLPPELNPFIEEYEYDEDEEQELDPQALAEQREREGGGEVKAVSSTKAADQLHKRGRAGSGGGGGARPAQRASAEEGEVEEDWEEENEKWD